MTRDNNDNHNITIKDISDVADEVEIEIDLDNFAYDDMSPSELVSELDMYVVGQSEAKKLLCYTVLNQRKINKYNTSLDDDINSFKVKKSNMVLVGPSGSGKTYLIETLGRILNSYVHVVDITHYTQSGYVGNSVTDIIRDFMDVVAGVDDLAINNPIIFIDEIDKIGNGLTEGEVSTTGVQRELLKIIEGGTLNLPTRRGKKDDDERALFDTNHITWIFGGSFSTFIEDKTKKLNKISSTGFIGKNSKEKITKDAKGKLKFKMEPEHLIEAGLIRELVGRMGNIVQLEELSREDYIKILTDPVDSILKQAQKIAELNEVTLTFNRKQIEEIADEAIRLGVGARGLKTIVDRLTFEKLYR